MHVYIQKLEGNISKGWQLLFLAVIMWFLFIVLYMSQIFCCGSIFTVINQYRLIQIFDTINANVHSIESGLYQTFHKYLVDNRRREEKEIDAFQGWLASEISWFKKGNNYSTNEEITAWRFFGDKFQEKL